MSTEHLLREETLRAEELLEREHMKFEVEKFPLEQRVDELLLHDEEAQELLDNKRRTLSERQELEDAIFELQRNHTLQVKSLTRELRADRERLESTMMQRLTQTAEEMARLTAIQREQRQQRAQSESGRLVSELTVLEQRSRELNDKNYGAQKRTESNKRDAEIETERRQMLIDKNHRLTGLVQGVVSELQEIETKLHVTHAALVGSEDGSLTIATVDEQYESIAFLRTELERVKQDTAVVQQRCKEARLRLLAAQGERHLPVTMPHSAVRHGMLHNDAPSPSQFAQGLDAPTIVACRSVILDALAEVNAAMQRTPVGGKHSITELRDPSELLHVQEFVARRINRMFSAHYPTAPPLRFLQAV
jgi:uncharacterized small protein (DUF1192 family)